MRCISLKELLFFISVWHVSQEMKDLLEEIQLSEDNPSELNAFFEDVVKFKNAFKMIRRAAAEVDSDGLTSSERKDKDIDDYVYDEENFVLNTKRPHNDKHAPNCNKMSHLQKSNRPLNDIFPHIYKEHSDQEYVDKYLENFDKGPRYRRQLAEDVEVVPKSTNGNIAVEGEKATMIMNNKNKAALMEKDAHETLMTIFGQLGKSSHPANQGTISSLTSGISTTVTSTPQSTIDTISMTTASPLGTAPSPAKNEKRSTEDQKEKSKRELKIDIIKDDKLIKEYSSDDNKNERVPCDRSKKTSIYLDIVQPAEDPNIIDSTKDHTESNRINVKEPKADLEHFEKVESKEIPRSTSENRKPMAPTGYVRNIPKFVGNIMDEIQTNYRVDAPERIRSQHYHYRPYMEPVGPYMEPVGPYMEPVYSDEPRDGYYARNFKNMIYEKPYYHQAIQQDSENEEDERYTPQDSMNRFRSRSLKSLLDIDEMLARNERNVQEILGMDNEDDYIEDLAFKTESPSTIKLAEEDDEISTMRNLVKSKRVEAVTSSTNTAEDLFYTSTTPAKVLTTSTSIRSSSTTSTSGNIVNDNNSRNKRNRKFRKIKGQKLLSRLNKNCQSCQHRKREIKENSGSRDFNLPRFKRKRCNTFKDSTFTSDMNDFNRINHKKRQYDFFENHNSRDSRFDNDNDNMKNYYTSNTWGNDIDNSEMYKKMRYFHFRPYAPNNKQYRDYNGDNYEDIERQKNSKNLKIKYCPYGRRRRCCNCCCCRKLMARSNSTINEHNIRKRDMIDGLDDEEANEVTEMLEKRTESDYGEEPDLSEGQNFKKHTKLKKHSKVMAPSKNFDDNYEYEEVPSEKSSDFIGSKKNSNPKRKCKKKKYKLKNSEHHTCQVSFRDRLARLKNKLFSSQLDETERALRDEIPYNKQYDVNRRSERQSEPTRLMNEESGFVGGSGRVEAGADSDNKRQCCDPCCNPFDQNPPCQHPCSPCPCPYDPGPCDSCPYPPCSSGMPPCDPYQPCCCDSGPVDPYPPCPCPQSSEPCPNCYMPCPPVPCPCDPCTYPPSCPRPCQPYPCPPPCCSSSNIFSDLEKLKETDSHIKERCPSAYSDPCPPCDPCACPPPCPCPYPPSCTCPCPPLPSCPSSSEERKYDEMSEKDHSDDHMVGERSSGSYTDSMNSNPSSDYDKRVNNEFQRDSMNRRSFNAQNLPDCYKYPRRSYPHTSRNTGEHYPCRYPLPCGYLPFMYFTDPEGGAFHRVKKRDSRVNDQPTMKLHDSKTWCTVPVYDPCPHPQSYSYPVPLSFYPNPYSCSIAFLQPCIEDERYLEHCLHAIKERCPPPYCPFPCPCPCDPCPCPNDSCTYPCDSCPCPCPSNPCPCPCPTSNPCPCPVLGPCIYPYPSFRGEDEGNKENSPIHVIKERCSTICPDLRSSQDPSSFSFQYPYSMQFSCPCPPSYLPQSSSPYAYICPSSESKEEECIEEKILNSRDAQMQNPSESNESGKEDPKAEKQCNSNHPECQSSAYSVPCPSACLPGPPPSQPCPSTSPAGPPPNPSSSQPSCLPGSPCPPSCQPCTPPCSPCPPCQTNTPPCQPNTPPCLPYPPPCQSIPPLCPACSPPNPIQPPCNQSCPDPCEPQNPDDYDDIDDNTDICGRNERQNEKITNLHSEGESSGSESENFSEKEDSHDIKGRCPQLFPSPCPVFPLSSPCDCESPPCPCTTCSYPCSTPCPPCSLPCCPFPSPCPCPYSLAYCPCLASTNIENPEEHRIREKRFDIQSSDLKDIKFMNEWVAEEPSMDNEPRGKDDNCSHSKFHTRQNTQSTGPCAEFSDGDDLSQMQEPPYRYDMHNMRTSASNPCSPDGIWIEPHYCPCPNTNPEIPCPCPDIVCPPCPCPMPEIPPPIPVPCNPICARPQPRCQASLNTKEPHRIVKRNSAEDSTSVPMKDGEKVFKRCPEYHHPCSMTCREENNEHQMNERCPASPCPPCNFPCPNSCNTYLSPCPIPFPCPVFHSMPCRRQIQNPNSNHKLDERCVIGFLRIPSPCSIHFPNPFKSCGVPCEPCCSNIPVASCEPSNTCGPPFAYSPCCCGCPWMRDKEHHIEERFDPCHSICFHTHPDFTIPNWAICNSAHFNDNGPIHSPGSLPYTGLCCCVSDSSLPLCSQVPYTISYKIAFPCAYSKKRCCSFPYPSTFFIPRSCPDTEIDCSLPELNPLPSSSHYPSFPVPYTVTYSLPCPCSYPGKRSNGFIPYSSYTLPFFSPVFYATVSRQNSFNADPNNLKQESKIGASSKSDSQSENKEQNGKQYTKRSTEKETHRIKRDWVGPKSSSDNPYAKRSRNCLDCWSHPYCIESAVLNDPSSGYEPLSQSPCCARTCYNCFGGYSCVDPETNGLDSSCVLAEPPFQPQDSGLNCPPWYWNCDVVGPCPCKCSNGGNSLLVQRRSNTLQPGVILPSTASASDLIASPGFDNMEKEKRKCPKPCEPLPLYSASPTPLPLSCDDTTTDMLAQRARQANAYLKNQYLNGRYSINNQNLPRNRRHLSTKESSSHTGCSHLEDLDRQVRRPHGVPRKPSNRRFPTQHGDLDYLQNLDTDRTSVGSQKPHNICKRRNIGTSVEDASKIGKIHRRNCNGQCNPQNEDEKTKSDLSPEDFMLLHKKSNSEYQDMHFAKEIVEAVMNKVNKNTNLRVKIGNALNKKRIYETETQQRNYAKKCSFEERAEYEEAKNLLRSVSCVLNKLVKKQIEEKLCEKLPNHLKNFLKRIVRPPKHRINQRHDDKYHEDTFLFRSSCTPSKLDQDKRSQLEVNLVKLLDRYKELDEDSKKRAAPLKTYISNHLDLLKKIEEERSDTEKHAIASDELIEANESPQTQMESNLEEDKLDSSLNNLDMMEKDLENLDLEKKSPQFQQPPFGMNSLNPVKLTEEDNAVENKLKKRNADRITQNKKSQHKRETEDGTSDKYKKLVKATEEVRFKRRNEEKIGEIFGNKKVDENDPDTKEQEDQVAFETPLVYRT